MNILMPQLGETVSEGKITRWFKAVGESVAAGENLCEIETDKVTVEVPSLWSGIMQMINVGVGTVAPVGAVIAVLGETAVAGTQASATTVAPPAPSPSPPAMGFGEASPIRRGRPLDPFREIEMPRRNFGRARLANGVAVTPLARRLAATAAIELAGIVGSGGRGRITARDVERAVAARPAPAPSEVDRPEEPIGEAHLGRPHKKLPIDGMRRAIARRLSLAKATIPHFFLSADIAVDCLSRVREEINAGATKDPEGKPVYKITLTDFMIKALALALQAVPEANTIWSDNCVLAFEHSDIGVAVAVPGGLLTPVILAAEAKPLAALSNEMKALAARARERALQPNEYRGGVTSISNLGMHSVRDFGAIINPPQSSILAIGATRRDAVEDENRGVVFASRLTATLSCDHRVIDGVLGARLLSSFREFLETPLRMLI
ncbi:MAG: 2-oxo acid dehydrogenase subunit E2 [Methylobacteriaceae bacterium]|nr:2-oxo acid dehydrogenase subunit E2 [Methylobacteriaceae bacterium]